MDVVKPCPNCGSALKCCCATSIVRYFQLLDKAQQRVSTPNSTSENLIDGQGCIDKLNFEIDHPLDQKTFLERLNENEIERRQIRLNDKKHYLQLLGEDSGVYVQMPFSSNFPYVKKFTTRPSAFGNGVDYVKAIRSFLEADEYSNARITRLDLAVNYPVSLQKFLTGFDCKNKRANSEYITSSSRTTGLKLGAGSEKFVIYDYGLKHKTGNDQTRIECQLSSSKLPIKSIRDLKTLPVRLAEHNPFDSIKAQEASVPSIGTEIDPSKVIKLSTMLSMNGFFATRTKLNANHNFQRDYLKFIKFDERYIQPSIVIQNAIQNFLKGEDDGKQFKENAS